MTKQVGILTFSATSTTSKICSAVAEGMSAADIEIFDMTVPETRADIIARKATIFTHLDHLIVGAPVHSGKLPLKAIECLSAIDGTGKDASAVVVYGNRDYGIALHSMVELLSGKGFSVKAAGAFIGQHSYADIVPVAVGRPDEADLLKARQLGNESLKTKKELNLESIPVQLDKISTSKDYSAIKPVHLGKLCVQCGICAGKCPDGLLSKDSGAYVDSDAKKRCIGCMACVYHCSKKAKIAKVNPIVKLIMKIILKQAARERKEPLILVSQ